MNNHPYNYCYPGEIFTGDAAWFDEYQEIDSSKIRGTLSYKRLKEALENTSQEKSFTSFYDQTQDKWGIVPVQNKELAEIARHLNKHLK